MSDSIKKQATARKVKNKTTQPPAIPFAKHTRKTNGKFQVSNYHQLPDSDIVDMRYLLQILTEVKNGNFGVRMPIDQTGLSGKICDTLNDIIFLNESRRSASFMFLATRSSDLRLLISVLISKF